MRTIKRLSIITILSATSFALHAQEEQPMRTLLGKDKPIHHGGWGAPTATYTRIMDQDAMLVGARGAWIIDHRFSLGLAGHGLVIPIENPAYDQHLLDDGRLLTKKSQFVAGYGGLLIEPVIAYRSPVHVTLPLIIGAGGCGYMTHSSMSGEIDPFTYEDDVSSFFVVEPGIEMEMNVIPLVRVGIGASYRHTSDVDLPDTPTDAMRGFNAGISIKVGSF